MLASVSLTAQNVELLDEPDLKNRDVDVVNLSEAGKDKLKLGLSLGYPMTGLTAGWQAGKSLEFDVLVGSLNYNSFGLGGSVMLSLVDVQIGGELFPLTAGPFLYAGLGGSNVTLSVGGMARMEYTFDFDLNLYLESGLAVNLGDNNHPWGIPVSLGIRYIF